MKPPCQASCPRSPWLARWRWCRCRPARFAAADTDTYKELETFMSVFERVRANYVDKVDDHVADQGRDRRHAGRARPAFGLCRGGPTSHQLRTTTDGNYGGLGLTVSTEDGAVKVVAADRGHAGRSRRDQGRATISPTSTANSSTAVARRSGRQDARHARHADQADHRPARAATSRSTSRSCARRSSFARSNGR